MNKLERKHSTFFPNRALNSTTNIVSLGLSDLYQKLFLYSFMQQIYNNINHHILVPSMN